MYAGRSSEQGLGLRLVAGMQWREGRVSETCDMTAGTQAGGEMVAMRRNPSSCLFELGQVIALDAVDINSNAIARALMKQFHCVLFRYQCHLSVI